LNYEDDFKSMITEIAVDNRIEKQLLKNFIEYFDNLGFGEGIKLFYPKGMFAKKSLVLFFFYKDKILTVEFNDNNSFKISTVGKVKTVELEVVPGSKLRRKLIIHPEAQEEVILDSTKDADPTRSEKHAKNIEEIYKHLV